MRKEIRENTTGLIKGWTEDRGDKIWAFDCFGRQVGYYDKGSQLTFDVKSGRAYSRGSDDTAGLIAESWAENKYHFYGN